VIKNAEGRVIWDIDVFGVVTQGPCPPTVNPSQWRQAKLTAIQGALRGDRRHLPGPGRGPVQHDAGRIRQRCDRAKGSNGTVGLIAPTLDITRTGSMGRAFRGAPPGYKAIVFHWRDLPGATRD
jgi:alkyl sulfatase BDS1-like metallo-beta-lactamase superfamily hydrolase